MQVDEYSRTLLINQKIRSRVTHIFEPTSQFIRAEKYLPHNTKRNERSKLSDSFPYNIDKKALAFAKASLFWSVIEDSNL